MGDRTRACCWFRWDDLRHACASLSLAVTPNLHVVKQRLGHEDIRSTINVYGRLVPNVDAALADALGEMWTATATPTESNVIELRARARARAEQTPGAQSIGRRGLTQHPRGGSRGSS